MICHRNGHRVSNVASDELDGPDQEGAAGLRRVRAGLPLLPRHPRPGGAEDGLHWSSSQRVSPHGVCGKPSWVIPFP